MPHVAKLRMHGNRQISHEGLDALAKLLASGALPALSELTVDDYEDGALIAACAARGISHKKPSASEREAIRQKFRGDWEQRMSS